MCARNILQGLNPLWTSIPSNLSLVAKCSSHHCLAPVVWSLLTWMWLYLATAQWELGQQKTLSLPQAEAMVLHALYMQITIWYIWPEFRLCEENEHLVINTPQSSMQLTSLLLLESCNTICFELEYLEIWWNDCNINDLNIFLFFWWGSSSHCQPSHL